jgi:hypothetical protein
LYDFAQNPDVRAAAKACLDYFCAIGAVKYFRGAFNGPTNRDYTHAQPFGGSAPCILWLYFGDCPQDNTAYESDEVHLLTSRYRPPQAVVHLARKNFPKPLEIFAAKPSYSATTSTDWKSPPEYFETQYFGRTFQMGSLIGGTTAGKTAVNGFKIVTTHSKLGGVAIQGIPGPDPKFVGSAKYVEGKVSGENRIGQNRNTAVWLVHGGDAPWTWVIPPGVEVQTHQGITFLVAEKTWIALHPLNTGEITRNPELTDALTTGKGAEPWKGSTVVSARGKGGAYCGVAIEVSEAPEFENFAAFRDAALAKSRVKADKLKDAEAEFTSASGRSIRLQFARTPKESRVVRDGQPHDFTEHARFLYRSAEKNPPLITQDWLGGSLTVHAGKTRFVAQVSPTGQYTFQNK